MLKQQIVQICQYSTKMFDLLKACHYLREEDFNAPFLLVTSRIQSGTQGLKTVQIQRDQLIMPEMGAYGKAPMCTPAGAMAAAQVADPVVYVQDRLVGRRALL
jgi:hypothetical protein